MIRGECDQDKLFEGRGVRFLETIKAAPVEGGGGTEIYDTKRQVFTHNDRGNINNINETLCCKVWQGAVRNCAFIADLSWTEHQALLHSSGEFSVCDIRDARIVDVYDCMFR